MSRASFRSQCVGLFLVAITPVYAVSFHSLGPVDTYASIPGSIFAMPVVSGDGSTVAGTGGEHGFTWTPAGGRVTLPGLYDNFPTALSYDGSVVVGGSLEPEGWRAASWSGGSKTPSYSGATYATAISADGLTTFGNQGSSGVVKYTEHVVWTITGLKNSRGASADGTVVAGQTYRIIPGSDWGPPYPSYPTATIWNNGVLTSLGSLTTDDRARSYAWGISPDGNVVYGYSSSTHLLGEGFRWTPADGMVGLGAAPGWDGPNYETWMKASNYDGSVLVGWARATSGSSNGRAIIWDAQNGIRYLDEILASQYGIDLTGWQLRAATGMSWDGQTILGYGISPQGTQEGWVVNIPEPATLVLAALAFACIGRKHR